MRSPGHNLMDFLCWSSTGNALRPETRVVYMSGYSDEIVSRHGMLDDDIVFLPKPFDTQQLTEKLAEALGED